MRQIILDTETTGLSPQEGHRIIEVAALEMIDRQLTDRVLQFYINPERDIPEEAIAIHGITDDTVADAPVFAQIADELVAFLANAEVLAHNAPFDEGFLNHELARLGKPPLAQFTDTLALARERFPGKKNSLDALCQRFGIDKSRRVYHGALIDCELLSQVYLELTRSQFTLDVGVRAGPAHAMRERKLWQGKVLLASAEELALHEAYLDALPTPALFRQPEAS